MIPIYACAASHIGKVRATNQDSGLIGTHIYAVADGMGGHAGGDVASALVIQHIAQNIQQFSTTQEAKAGIEALVKSANAMLQSTVAQHKELRGMGTTLDLATIVGNTLVAAHIGDSRIYRIRNNKLWQITKDHTFVQLLIDLGKITAEEAATHPKRSILMRVLGDTQSNTAPKVDFHTIQIEPGDTFLMCSDGLSSYVEKSAIAKTINALKNNQQVAQNLISLALQNGAPDNVTVVVLHAENTQTQPSFNAETEIPLELLGAAALPVKYPLVATTSAQPQTPKLNYLFKSRKISSLQQNETYVPATDGFLESIFLEHKRIVRIRRAIWSAGAGLILLVLGLSIWLTYNWTQSQYYISSKDGYVAIYKGVPSHIGPISLSSVALKSNIKIDSLSGYEKSRIESKVSFPSLQDAKNLLFRLQNEQNEQ